MRAAKDGLTKSPHSEARALSPSLSPKPDHWRKLHLPALSPPDCAGRHFPVLGI